MGLASATPDSGRRSGSAQAWFVFALIVVVIVGVVVIGGKDDGKPYDLDSAGVSGYKGMRLTLERLGARIDRIDAADVGGPATAHANAVFVPVADGAPHELVRRLERFARSGGVVVLGSETRASSGAIGASGSSGVDIVGATSAASRGAGWSTRSGSSRSRCPTDRGVATARVSRRS